MHPAAILLSCLAGLLAVQFFAYGALLLLALLLAIALWPLAGWWRWLKKSRWLLLCLWLVLAYGAPGEAWFGLDWAPTYEGVAMANLQSMRLLLSLGLICWLLQQLGRERLVIALWGVLLPLQRLGLKIAPLVVRLALVLENLAEAPPQGYWRQLLALDCVPTLAPGRMHFVFPIWRQRDSWLLIVVASALWGASRL